MFTQSSIKQFEPNTHYCWYCQKELNPKEAVILTKNSILEYCHSECFRKNAPKEKYI